MNCDVLDEQSIFSGLQYENTKSFQQIASDVNFSLCDKNRIVIKHGCRKSVHTSDVWFIGCCHTRGNTLTIICLC